jgi:transcriptional regulator with XRE-family HTH domain
MEIQPGDERMLLKAFGGHVAEVRKSRNLTQKGLSLKTNISRASVASIETGRRWPQLHTLHRIADGLDITLYDLFSGVDWPERYKDTHIEMLFAQ